MAEKRPEHRLRRRRALLTDTGGAVAIEYGLLALMISVALLGMMSMTDVSNHIGNVFLSLANTISGG